MNKILLIIITFLTITGCNKENEVKPQEESLEPKLIGRWEVFESTHIGSDGKQTTYTYGPDGDFEIAYSIGIDYSSGFELRENNILDLIWGSKNKEQLFSWNLEKRTITIDDGTLVFDIIEVNDSLLEISSKSDPEISLLNGKTDFKMNKLN